MTALARPAPPTSRDTSAPTIGNEILIRRLRSVAPLNAREVELIFSLGGSTKVHEAGSMIGRQVEGGAHPRLIVSGWASRPRFLSDGRRQMLTVLLPGDLLGDRGHRRPLAMTPAVALTRVRTVSATPLFDALERHGRDVQGLTQAIATVERMEEGWLLDHIVRLGCQTAVQRIANWLLEVYGRLCAIEFTHDGSFPMPLTQETLAELLGLSLVHVSRVIRQLRREEMVEIRSGVVKVLDFRRLALLADSPDPEMRPGS